MRHSEETIRERLRTVIDPELYINIVDMGLIYDVQVTEDTITVEMTLTTQGCPMKSYMETEVNAALSSLEGINEVFVEFVWVPPWSPDMIDREALEHLNQGG